MKTRITYAFDIVMIIIFVAMTVIALRYNPSARQIPLIFGTIGSCMLFLQLVYNFVPGTRNILKIIHSERFKDNESTKVAEAEETLDEHEILNYQREWSRALIGVFGITCFVVLIRYIGYVLAAPIFIFLFMKFAFREGWQLSVVVSLGVLLFVWVLFSVLLSFYG